MITTRMMVDAIGGQGARLVVKAVLAAHRRINPKQYKQYDL
jgi:hypothetical protein